MADVQVEHGHLRLANRLAEAILAAEFSGTQVRILLALVRLTYGWKRKTVRVGLGDLAGAAGVAYTGGFRRALTELADAGVVLEVTRPHPGAPGVYAIQKDHERWGRFSVAHARLAASWGARPDSDDARLADEPPTSTGAMPPAASAPTGADIVPPQGQDYCPHGGTTEPSKDMAANDLDARKESERQRKKTTTETPAREEPECRPIEAIVALHGAGARAKLVALRALVPDPHWVDVEAFLRTKPASTWEGWCGGMAKIVGPGSQYLPEDLAGACADALTLTKPIEGTGVLRDFVAKHRRQRIDEARSDVPRAGARPRGRQTQTEVMANARAVATQVAAHYGLPSREELAHADD